MEGVGKASHHFGGRYTWSSGPAHGAFGRVSSDGCRALPAGRQPQRSVCLQVEAANIQQWNFTPVEAARITQAVLSAYHQDDWPGFQKAHELLKAWIPQTEAALLPIERHLLQIMNPGAVAVELAAFFARHPIQVYA